MLPGRYRVRLTKGAHVIETSFDVGLDLRAPFSLDDRKAQLEAALRVRALFGSMTALVQRLQTLKAASDARATLLPEGDALQARLHALSARTEELRKLIVATKEGGAITGEERLREHADLLYYALLRWEGKPGRSQVEHIDALRKEFEEVKAAHEALLKSGVGPVNEELVQRKLAPLP